MKSRIIQKKANNMNGQIISQIEKEETFEEMIQRCTREEYISSFSLIDFTRIHINKRELFEKMITFLSMKHTEGEKFSILTRAGWTCEVEMDSNSGLAFESVQNSTGVVLYLGIGTYITTPKKYPTFLILDDKGVSYWDNIHDIEIAIKEGEALLYRVPYFKQCLKNVLPKKILLNFNSLIQENNDKLLSHSMNILSDAVIHCRDGDVEIVRYLFARDSEFFLHLFRYESTKREFKMNFDKIIIQTYMDYKTGLTRPDIEKICEDVIQFIEFGLFIQDIHFVKEIYTLVVEECDADLIIHLNESVKKMISLD